MKLFCVAVLIALSAATVWCQNDVETPRKMKLIGLA
jgi:hypothetical protein